MPLVTGGHFYRSLIIEALFDYEFGRFLLDVENTLCFYKCLKLNKYVIKIFIISPLHFQSVLQTDFVESLFTIILDDLVMVWLAQILKDTWARLIIWIKSHRRKLYWAQTAL
jgi:hypothetical protein